MQQKSCKNCYHSFIEGGEYNPAGRNRRTVWVIPTQPTPEAHFATFPEALVEPCIKAGTSERGCCEKCGAPWVRVVENTPEYQARVDASKLKYQKTAKEKLETGSATGGHGDELGHFSKEIKTVGWQPTCEHGMSEEYAPWSCIPCTILDPFGGSGTVAKVARDLNRNAILIEINPQYVEIAKRKLRANEQLFTDAESSVIC